MQTFRPQIHFAPKAGWMNDPNGLVYYAGEYHLFYQHYPHNTIWGPMHWGHAVSKDLVHWEHLDIALEPYEDTMIFSGSAVIDTNNTSGFGYNADGEPPMIAIYTSHIHRPGFVSETQSIAYSHDRGRTFTRYEGNPVITYADAKDFRDPKVFWYEQGGYWVLTVVCFDHVKFYRSADLKNWEHLSDFGQGHGSPEGVWECPDLIQVGDQWVLLISLTASAPNGGSATQYFVGHFDGVTFTNANASNEVRWIDYGCDNYAGVTWTNNPDDRVLFIGWMNNWKYAIKTPSVGFRGSLTTPREFSLVDGHLVQKPIRELEKMKRFISTGKYALSFPTSGAYELQITGKERSEWMIRLEHGEDEETVIRFNPQEGKMYFDRRISGIGDFQLDFAKVIEAPYEPATNQSIHVQLLIDTSSIELFVNGGKTVMTNQVFPVQWKHVFVREGIEVDKLTLSKYDL